MNNVSTCQIQTDVSLFLFKEARLLDEQNYDAWLELLTEDVEYWIPISNDQTDPLLHVSITYENRQLLELRIKRLSHPQAHSIDRKPHSTHVTSNIMIDENPSQDGHLIVKSSFLVLGYQEDADNKQTVYGGIQTHHLSQSNGEYKISKKKIVLNNADAPHGNIQIIL